MNKDEIIKNKLIKIGEDIKKAFNDFQNNTDENNYLPITCENIANLEETKEERIKLYKELLKNQGINPDKDGIIILQGDYIKAFQLYQSIESIKIDITVGE